LMRWAARRSEYLAQANVSSARQASNMGYLGNSYGSGYGMGAGSWAYNPWYNMFTYLPYGNGMYYSPFGFPYYSAGNVGYFVPVQSTHGSAFPVSSTVATSPHYSGTTGSYNMAPRGSYSSGSTGGSTAPASSGFGGSAAPGGTSSGGVSSGSAGHSGGASSGGMGGGRGK
jgi:hypothetical protein